MTGRQPLRGAGPLILLLVINVLEQPSDDSEVQAARDTLAEGRNHAAGENSADDYRPKYGVRPTGDDLVTIQ
jgi:hypothetical protein